MDKLANHNGCADDYTHFKATRSMVYKERGFFETSPVPNFFRNLD